jgi:hypothetical protein
MLHVCAVSIRMHMCSHAHVHRSVCTKMEGKREKLRHRNIKGVGRERHIQVMYRNIE